MNKPVFFSVLFLAFLGCSMQVKSSDNSLKLSGNPIVDVFVVTAVVATFVDLLTGQEGSIRRAAVGISCLHFSLTEKGNKVTGESALVAAAMIGNHVDNIRKNKYK
jgi:hypothetical protein